MFIVAGNCRAFPLIETRVKSTTYIGFCRLILTSTVKQGVLSSRPSLYSFLFCIAVGSLVTGSILLAPESDRAAVQSWTILLTSGVATMTALLFAFMLRKIGNTMARLVTYLAFGLLLWFVAEGVWMYYVNFLQVELPYPSLADVFYIAAYPLVGYSLHRLSRGASFKQENRLVVSTIAVTITAFITNVFILEIVNSAVGFTQLVSDEVLILAISVAYPLLDAYLFIPSIIILYTLRSSREHLTWSLIAASVLVMAVADTGFGYTALVEIQALSTVATWDIMYNISYIMLATAMINGIMVERSAREMYAPNKPRAGNKSAAVTS